MVKFLLHHAVALEEKVEEGQIARLEMGAGIVAESEHLERSRVTGSIIRDIQNTELF
jgi:hypothetical protein